MKKYIITLCLFITAPLWARYIGTGEIKVFPTQTDQAGWHSRIVGQIIAFSSMTEFDKADLYGRAMERSKATIRLSVREGIREGDTLYVIDSHNLVVAKVRVKVLFNSISFGPMLTGYGNFRQAGEGYRVIQKIEDADAREAYRFIARGDYFRSIGDRGRAMEEYKKSLEYDKGNPATHLALGELYYQEKIYRYAYHELSRAYEGISRLADNDDRFLLLSMLTGLIQREVFENSYLSTALKKKLTDQGINYGKEALRIKKDSPDVLKYLGYFYYRGPAADHEKARSYFIQVLDYRSDDVETLIALSNLYLLHRNSGKAQMFVDKALQVEPNNEDALAMKKKIDLYER